MKKVLIVDDEMLVRIGLKTMIAWEELGFKVVGEASNGREALNIIEEKEIDILITDISMPVLGGIELIKNIRQDHIGDNLKIIILTHYKDFEYARAAINYGTSDYILKSELTPENLIKILNSFTIQTQKPDIEKQAKNGLDYTKLLKYLISKEFNSELEYISYLKKFNFQNQHLDFFVFGGNIFVENISDLDNIQKKGEIIKHVLEDTFNSDNFESYFYSNGIEFIGIIVCKKLLINFNEIFKSKIFLFKENAHQLLNLKPLVSNYRKISTLEDFYGVNKSILREKIELYFDKEFESSLKRDDKFSVDMKYLYSLLLKENRDELQAYLKLIFSFLYNKNEIWLAYKTLYKIDILVKETFNVFNKNSKFLDGMEIDHFIIKNNFSDHKVGIIKNIERLTKIDKNEMLSSYIINKAIDYIKKNYTSEITLTNIADYLEISSNYLSSLFKKEMKQNLKSYINLLRINKAKERLLNSNDRIYYIAYEVGYSNPHYFSKIFKETTGLTCKEYRNMYSKKYNEPNIEGKT